MKTEHTPGPWEVYSKPQEHWMPQAIVACGEGGEERHQNARLISAAPDLLAAMLRLLEYPDNNTPLHPGSLDWEDARAAVAKALGTKP